MNSMILRANNTTINGVAPVLTGDNGINFPVVTGGTTAVALEDISTPGTTDVAVTLIPNQQYWCRISNPGTTMTINFNVDDTAFPSGSVAEFCLEYPISGAFITPIFIKHNNVEVFTVSLNPEIKFIVVRIVKLGETLKAHSI